MPIRSLLFLILFVPLSNLGAVALAGEPLPEVVSFSEHIRPIFAQHCLECHGGIKQAGGISYLDSRHALAEGESGNHAIVPGDSEKSYLIERVTDPDPDLRMPPPDHGPALSKRDIGLLRRWIEQGAKWEKHWAFVKPVAPLLPPVPNESWCTKPLDYFVLARLEKEGLSPSPPADRRTWLRRVSLDLIGLPPTLQEIRDFESDQRAGAYERVVDRLLASPQFGERWASMWLDLARYADSRGYERDLGRTVWPYRDWVIRALNADMPFGEFTIKQLAGDLLPNATIDDRLATAFHRNSPTNDEGGTDDEEFRVAAVIDRVNTTWQTWQGTTFGCAQCHDHPHDPIGHDEFYQFMALVNTTRDADLPDEPPYLDVPIDPQNVARAEMLDAKISQLRRGLHERFMPIATADGAWTYLAASRATSTGSAKLRATTADGYPEVLAEGTISVGSRYQLEFPLPKETSQIAALRIDALPTDLAEALRHPEFGFMLSELRVEVVPADGAKGREVTFEMALSDEAEPMFDPEDSLRRNDEGWGEFTRIQRPSFAVFIAREPVQFPPGATLRILLRQDKAASETVAMVLRRARFAISDGQEWANFMQDDAVSQMRKELAEVGEERREIESVAVPVVVEQPADKRRPTFEFVRGNWLDTGAEVKPNVPELFPPLPADATHDRLALARWLVSPENPLAARVMVNRLWEQLFGSGIIETVEDFGSAGSPPSHPELLDHLAISFETDWSIKRLIREMVLSATYRQDSKATDELRIRDPRNRLLARGPRNRLTAEMVRDQALAVSGLLSATMYGPPVMPPQPDGIWRSVFSDEKWITSDGENRFRRAIYTYWKRTSPYPSMIMFDAPSREVCTARRNVTDTPLQALVTLNDPVYVECARALAERMLAEGGSTVEDQIAFGYELATGHIPSAATLDVLRGLHDAASEEFGSEPSAVELAADAETYAMTAVANALLNLDAALIK
jgi:hypothetical protein